MELNESPVLLLYHTRQNIVRKDLPVSLFESGKLLVCHYTISCVINYTTNCCAVSPELHTVDDRPSLTFVQSKFTIEVCSCPALLCSCACTSCAPLSSFICRLLKQRE